MGAGQRIVLDDQQGGNKMYIIFIFICEFFRFIAYAISLIAGGKRK